MSMVRFRPEAPNADLAHLVERHLAKVEVASSSLVIRSNKKSKAFCLAFFVLQYRETRTGQPVRVATVRGTVAVPACVPVRAEAHRASLVIRSNKESKAFCLAFFVLQYCETRTGQPARVATVRGTVAMPACVPVRAKAQPILHTIPPPRLWPNLPAPPYLAALQGSADLLQ